LKAASSAKVRSECSSLAWTNTSGKPGGSNSTIGLEDIETAIENYRELYEFLIEDRAAP
jgi:hypothetical protein